MISLSGSTILAVIPTILSEYSISEDDETFFTGKPIDCRGSSLMLYFEKISVENERLISMKLKSYAVGSRWLEIISTMSKTTPKCDKNTPTDE